MKNRDLLKEAIADAKTVKDTAIANAKKALEESFSPYLKEKLAAKLSEMDNEDEVNENQENEDDVNEYAETQPKDKEEAHFVPKVKENEEEELDLEALLKELESDVPVNNEKPEDQPGFISEKKEEKKDDDKEEKKDDKDKKDKDADGVSDDKDDEIDIASMSEDDLKAFVEEVIGGMVAAGELEAGEGEEEGLEGIEGMESGEEGTETAEDEIDIDVAELVAEIKNSKVKKPIVENEEVKKLKKELNEAIEAIKKIKSELTETNLLNAKLLYSNKIFRAKTLTEDQKVKVLAAFDKTKNKGEAKAVYETIMENLKTTPVAKKNITESFIGGASKSSGIIKESKPILETNDQFARWQHLAGIKKQK